MRFNIQKLKEQLTLDDYSQILHALGVINLNTNDKVWNMNTICHHREPNDGGINLRFYTDKRVFKCFSRDCDVSDIIALVQTRGQLFKEDYSFLDAVNFIIDNSHLNISDIQGKNLNTNSFDYTKLWNKFLNHTVEYEEPKIYNDNILNLFQKIYPLQWVNEGISINSMKKYNIGYYDRIQATTIPCYDENDNLRGIRGRFWLPDDVKQGKYRPIQLLDNTIYSFPCSMFFYGENKTLNHIKKTKEVILVESEKAVLQSDTWFDNESITLGMYGKNLGKYRANELISWGIEKCTIAIDNDYHTINDNEYIQFVNNVNNIWELLHSYMQVDVCYNNLGYDDMYKQNIFDYDEERFEKLWKNKEVI